MFYHQYHVFMFYRGCILVHQWSFGVWLIFLAPIHIYSSLCHCCEVLFVALSLDLKSWICSALETNPQTTQNKQLIMQPTLVLAFLFSSHFLLSEAAGGQWQLLQESIGISAMHMQLLHTDHVVIFDRTNFGVSKLSLPDGKCRFDPDDTALIIDCSTHSAEYDVANNSIRPLMVQTDVWCSSESAMLDSRLV
ncbi:putative galactose oxidase, beta-propeller [Rosa chinensis]|uniref:Putative galactose oxidase, beta-propeller n=1 Tax=Rosa chinensis TaxID=74649 RepID=A0A2P6PZ07_ROSCH|nr:putative galactose oxidase, beta-propeller [Rosa chinensis]